MSEVSWSWIRVFECTVGVVLAAIVLTILVLALKGLFD